MCLMVTLRARELPTRARNLGDVFSDVFASLRGGRNLLNVHACDMLADSANWNAATWEFTPDGSRRLAQEVDAVLANSADDLELTATWGGDRTQVERDVTREQLLDLIHSSKLETRALYRIHH